MEPHPSGRDSQKLKNRQEREHIEGEGTESSNKKTMEETARSSIKSTDIQQTGVEEAVYPSKSAEKTTRRSQSVRVGSLGNGVQVQFEPVDPAGDAIRRSQSVRVGSLGNGVQVQVEPINQTGDAIRRSQSVRVGSLGNGVQEPIELAEENRSHSQTIRAESLEKLKAGVTGLEESQQPRSSISSKTSRQESVLIKELIGEELLWVILENHEEDLLIFINDIECNLSQEVISLFEEFAEKIQIQIIDVNNMTADFVDFREALEMFTDCSPPVVFFKKNFICNHADAMKANYFRHLDLLLEPPLCPIYHVVIIGSSAGAQSAIEEIETFYQSSNIRYKMALVEWTPPVYMGDAQVIALRPQGNLPRNLLWNAIREAGFLNLAAPVFEGGERLENDPSDRWDDALGNMQNDVEWANWTFRKRLAELDIDFYRGGIEFIGPNKIYVSTNIPPDDSDDSTADTDDGSACLVGMRFIICGGSRPRIKEFSGFEHCVTIDRFLNEEVLPTAALIIGNSVETFETAHLIAAYGGEVTVMTRSNKWLPNYDQECVNKIIASFKDLNARFIRISKIIYIKELKSGYEVRVRLQPCKYYTKLYSTVIADFGRVPISADINVQRAGVQIDPESHKIIVSSEFKSTNQSIWAFGSTARGHLGTAHFELLAGKRVVNLILNGVDNVRFPKLFPQSVLTPLEYGFVGETEKSARLNYKTEIYIYESDCAAMPITERIDQRSRITNPSFHIKIICVDHWHCSHKKAVERVVGIHFLGPNAGRLITGFAASIEKGITKRQFIEQISMKGSTELGLYQTEFKLKSNAPEETIIPPTAEETRGKDFVKCNIPLRSTNEYPFSLEPSCKSKQPTEKFPMKPNPYQPVNTSPVIEFCDVKPNQLLTTVKQKSTTLLLKPSSPKSSYERQSQEIIEEPQTRPVADKPVLSLPVSEFWEQERANILGSSSTSLKESIIKPASSKSSLISQTRETIREPNLNPDANQPILSLPVAEFWDLELSRLVANSTPSTNKVLISPSPSNISLIKGSRKAIEEYQSRPEANQPIHSLTASEFWNQELTRLTETSTHSTTELPIKPLASKNSLGGGSIEKIEDSHFKPEDTKSILSSPLSQELKVRQLIPIGTPSTSKLSVNPSLANSSISGSSHEKLTERNQNPDATKPIYSFRGRSFWNLALACLTDKDTPSKTDLLMKPLTPKVPVKCQSPHKIEESPTEPSASHLTPYMPPTINEIPIKPSWSKSDKIEETIPQQADATQPIFSLAWIRNLQRTKLAKIGSTIGLLVKKIRPKSPSQSGSSERKEPEILRRMKIQPRGQQAKPKLSKDKSAEELWRKHLKRIDDSFIPTPSGSVISIAFASRIRQPIKVSVKSISNAKQMKLLPKKVTGVGESSMKASSSKNILKAESKEKMEEYIHETDATIPICSSTISEFWNIELNKLIDETKTPYISEKSIKTSSTKRLFKSKSGIFLPVSESQGLKQTQLIPMGARSKAKSIKKPSSSPIKHGSHVNIEELQVKPYATQPIYSSPVSKFWDSELTRLMALSPEESEVESCRGSSVSE